MKTVLTITVESDEPLDLQELVENISRELFSACLDDRNLSTLEIAVAEHPEIESVYYDLGFNRDPEEEEEDDQVDLHAYVSDHEGDDPMDGDAESALASAGFGMDEDYGYFGGDE